MFQGMLAKLSQNEELKMLLLETDTNMIAEASPTDDHWGTGISLRSKDIFDSDKWKGKNFAGKTLERVRQTLK